MFRHKTFWIYAALVLFSIAPLLSVVLSIGVANLQGCAIDEGSVHECKMLGVDIGKMLYTGFVMGWLSLMSLPMGFVAIVAFTIFNIIKRKIAPVK